MTFSERLMYGAKAEEQITEWLVASGFSVMAASGFGNGSKQQYIFTSQTTGVLYPDLFVWGTSGSLTLIEVKRKRGFSLHRNTNKLVTGIDEKYYNDYIAAQIITGSKVFLVFVSDGQSTKDTASSPTGVYGNSLDYLRRNENHRYDGIVYFAIESLIQLASPEDLREAINDQHYYQ